MAKLIRFGAAALVAVMVLGMAVAIAQEKPAPPKPAQIPLKLQLVLSRYQGEKKISSLPYQLWLTTNVGARTALRMGVQVPVPTTTFGSTEKGPVSSYNLKDVGTNIDCLAETGIEPGTYRLYLTVTDSSISTGGTHSSGESPVPSGMPIFRNFQATFPILLRDGQTGQYATATDPVTGEVLKIDATLNVLK